MTLLLLTATIIQLSLSSRIRLQPRIINGNPTTHDDYPYMVSLRWVLHDTNTSSHFCGGSLIQQEPVTVLTAGHCDIIFTRVEGKNYTIFADIGRTTVTEDENYERFTFEHYVTHPNFTTDRYGNIAYDDVGIWFFQGSTSQPSLSHQLFDGDTSSLVDDAARVIGYGAHYNNGTLELTDTLEYSDMTVISNSMCNLGLSEWYNTSSNYNSTMLKLFLSDLGLEFEDYPWQLVQPGLMCAVKEDASACYGDSGGPLMHIDREEQIGIVSSGVPDCSVGISNIFADVGFYYDWIWKTVADFRRDTITSTEYESESSDSDSDSDSSESSSSSDDDVLSNSERRNDNPLEVDSKSRMYVRWTVLCGIIVFVVLLCVVCYIGTKTMNGMKNDINFAEIINMNDGIEIVEESDGQRCVEFETATQYGPNLQ